MGRLQYPVWGLAERVSWGDVRAGEARWHWGGEDSFSGLHWPSASVVQGSGLWETAGGGLSLGSRLSEGDFQELPV